MGVLIRPELRVDDTRFRANLATLQDRVDPAALMLVVKDDAYGHGLRGIAEAAVSAGIRWIGAYDVPSAVLLREAVGPEVSLFAWVTSADDEIAEAIIGGVDLGVGTLEYLDRVIVQAERLGARARVHLKVDTGLHRNGLSAAEWPRGVETALRAQRESSVELVGAWSHLAEASDEEDDAAHACFLAALGEARELGAEVPRTHLTASAATWLRPELRGDIVRVGAFCYGIRSADGPELPGLVPIASLVAPVVGIEGEEAVVSIGALDGVPSTLAGRVGVGTPAGARPLTAVGLDRIRVRAWPGAQEGDEVVLFGDGAHGESSATTLAEAIGTVGEEILTRLASRVRRRHITG
ncbi:alanine racemase [Microbacterium resistens]|uniref:Alanine racemase n=1 Tax=Microbacterium resistens TaxID=156977 RepID=A0ABU1SA66_9MICO|nr:alanine racemase [Microbacterium resistens]MDR6866148.1 alanine racemase [Microbacterium resistens]